jgi:hypothetical protein
MRLPATARSKVRIPNGARVAVPSPFAETMPARRNYAMLLESAQPNNTYTRRTSTPETRVNAAARN